MRINDKYLSFPPYISTSWSHVKALYMEDGILFIHLEDGQVVSIPGMKAEIIELIFKAHAAHLEREGNPEEQLRAPITGVASIVIATQDRMSELPFRLNGPSFEMLSSTLQHTPALSNAPDLPKELIQKITSITKIVHGDDPQYIPKAEPHCNCFYCQIARSIHENTAKEHKKDTENVVEEEISESELQFQQWDIKQVGEKLFTATNKLDPQEKYNVFLGQPVGCTCGKAGCEHVLAVLKS